MSRIQTELDQIAARLATAHPREQTALFVAQQALAWAQNPEIAQAPCDFITGIREASEGCLVGSRPPQS